MVITPGKQELKKGSGKRPYRIKRHVEEGNAKGKSSFKRQTKKMASGKKKGIKTPQGGTEKTSGPKGGDSDKGNRGSHSSQ